jgi:hypothetical protein
VKRGPTYGVEALRLVSRGNLEQSATPTLDQNRQLLPPISLTSFLQERCGKMRMEIRERAAGRHGIGIYAIWFLLLWILRPFTDFASESSSKVCYAY